jgi:hypothetical protein
MIKKRVAAADNHTFGAISRSQRMERLNQSFAFDCKYGQTINDLHSGFFIYPV